MSRRGENIYKRKDGRWEGRFLDSYDQFGKARYRSVYAKTYLEVKEKVDSRKKHALVQSSSKSLKLTNYCNNWLETVRLKHKASTYSKYKNICQKHIIPALGGYNATLISDALIEELLSKKLDTELLSPKTVNGILCVLKQIFIYIEGVGVRTNCNFSNIFVRQNKREMRVLTLEEQKKLADFLMVDMDLIKLGVYLSLFTGIRIGELCALKWENIQLKKQLLHIEQTMQRVQIFGTDKKTEIMITPPKSKCSDRDIPLPKFLCGILKKHKCSKDCFLLSGSTEDFIEPRIVQYAFKKYIKECGFEDVNFHALRHTFATRCVESGFEIKTLSEILGHSSVKITLDKYVHSSMDLKRENMEKLASIL